VEVRYDFDGDLNKLFDKLEEIRALKHKGCYCCYFNDKQKLLYESDAFEKAKYIGIEPQIKADNDPFRSDLPDKTERVRKAYENFLIKSNLIKLKKKKVENRDQTVMKSRVITAMPPVILKSRSTVGLSKI
jgi:hypothetical protein